MAHATGMPWETRIRRLFVCGQNTGKTQGLVTVIIPEPDGMVIRKEWEEGAREEWGQRDGSEEEEEEEEWTGGWRERDKGKLLGSGHDPSLRGRARQQWPHGIKLGGKKGIDLRLISPSHLPLALLIGRTPQEARGDDNADKSPSRRT